MQPLNHTNIASENVKHLWYRYTKYYSMHVINAFAVVNLLVGYDCGWNDSVQVF